MNPFEKSVGLWKNLLIKNERDGVVSNKIKCPHCHNRMFWNEQDQMGICSSCGWNRKKIKIKL